MRKYLKYIVTPFIVHVQLAGSGQHDLVKYFHLSAESCDDDIFCSIRECVAHIGLGYISWARG